MTAYNEYQYQYLTACSQDQYANTKWDIISRRLSKQRPLSILNAGCGSGEFSLQLAASGHHVLGIDPTPEHIRIAQQNAKLFPEVDCSFQISYIEDFTPAENFDCVMATDVLEHIKDDYTAFSKLASFVKQDGLMIVTVPAGQWLFGYHDVSIGHYRRYSRKSLHQLVSNYCSIDLLRYFGFSLIPVCYLYSKLLRKPYPVVQTGDQSKFRFISNILRLALHCDKMVPMPLGTSLIMIGTRNAVPIDYSFHVKAA